MLEGEGRLHLWHKYSEIFCQRRIYDRNLEGMVRFEFKFSYKSGRLTNVRTLCFQGIFLIPYFQRDYGMSEKNWEDILVQLEFANLSEWHREIIFERMMTTNHVEGISYEVATPEVVLEIETTPSFLMTPRFPNPKPYVAKKKKKPQQLSVLQSLRKNPQEIHQKWKLISPRNCMNPLILMSFKEELRRWKLKRVSL